MARQGTSVKRAAEQLGVTAKWIRDRIAEGAVSPERAGGGRNGRYALTDADLELLRSRAAANTERPKRDVLAKIETLEAERANLLARLAWEHATARANEQALEQERRRVEALTAEVAAQRTRVEELKALSVFDRLVGRHKGI
jgi:DNA-binding transcriptional MerR regulator